jgi:SOS regulatory protein LexA
MSVDISSATQKLRDFFLEYSRLPSYQEICELFGFASKNAAFQLIKKMIAEGILEKDSHGKLIPKKLNLPLPHLGTIQAGFLTTSEEQVPEMVSFDEFLVKEPKASFMLRVSGDSMIDAGIQPDDIVIVERVREPRHGDIVAACVDNECTLKYFERQSGKVVFMPANEKYPPIHPKGNFHIYGKVVSLIRKY